jgi:hypothetical protein
MAGVKRHWLSSHTITPFVPSALPLMLSGGAVFSVFSVYAAKR